MLKTRNVILLAATEALCLAGSVLAPDPSAATLQQQVAAMAAELESAGLAKAGISVTDLRSGNVLVDLRAGEPFIPASNQKILTSAFALARLGGTGQFTTAVYSLDGNVVVAGDGDPTIGDSRVAEADGKDIYWQLDEWAVAVKDKLGPRVGDLIVCVSGPLRGYRHEDWPRGQWHNWYEAPAASLNFNNNCFDVSMSLEGGTVTARVIPGSRFIRVVNNAVAGPKSVWSARSNGDDSVLTIRGTVAAGMGEPTSVAANNPPMFLGRVFADRLVRAGVELTGTVREVKHGDVDWSSAAPLARTVTPLAVVMARANKRSLNMAAECMFLRAGDGTWSGSAKLMAETLQQAYGLSPDSLVVRDGGGLSRGNRVTPGAVTTLLAALARRDDAQIFLDSLPVSGEDGTLRRRLVGEEYRQRVLAKTGYIAGVSALSGYILDGDGKPAIAFSILLNNVKSTRRGKTLQDDVCRMCVNYLESGQVPPAKQ